MHEEPAEVTTWLIHYSLHASTLDSTILLTDFDIANTHTMASVIGNTENPVSSPSEKSRKY
jgi:hypothetical protein